MDCKCCYAQTVHRPVSTSSGKLKNVSRAYCPNVYTVAKGKYSAQLIADTKILLKLLVLYLPLPIYWALFDQQVSILA